MSIRFFIVQDLEKGDSSLWWRIIANGLDLLGAGKAVKSRIKTFVSADTIPQGL